MKFIIAVAASITAMLFKGLVLKVIWGWFIVTTFQAPALNIPQALGLCLVASMLTYQYRPTGKEEIGEFVMTGISLVVSLCTLGMAWIVKFWL